MQDISYQCDETRKQELTHLLVIFIIQFVQPLYILKNDAFRKFVNACEPGYMIPCEKTVKNLIYEAYLWSKDQLINLLGSAVTSIHLTTDLWTAKSNHGYIGVTATWLASDFTFHEVLLTCSNLKYPHTGEAISEELLRIIEQWQLQSTVFTIATDSASNMVKSVHIVSRTLPSVKRQPCAVHTLQLSVNEGLKYCKNVHRRIKSLQNFFRYPKQAQRLQEAQLAINDEIFITEDSEVVTSPLDVLTDTRTRWNSTFLAWKRVLKLHNAMRYVSTTLLAKDDNASKKEGEKLEELCLTHEEKM